VNHTSSSRRKWSTRAKLDLRDRTLVSVFAYSGPRPEEIVCRLSWNDIGNQTIR
jgi:hypothetical protein